MHYLLRKPLTGFHEPTPLAGRRVIELGTKIAAPYATHILSQLGAEVIKIEPPSGDTTRALVRGGPSGTFLAYNHGKKSFCIDLGRPDGLDAFRRLVATADILIHNLAQHDAQVANYRGGSRGGQSHSAFPVTSVAMPPGLSMTTLPPIRWPRPRPGSWTITVSMVVSSSCSRPSYHDQFAGAYAVIRILSLLLDPPARIEDRRIEIGLYETGLHVAGRDLAGVQLKMQLLGRPGERGRRRILHAGLRCL